MCKCVPWCAYGGYQKIYKKLLFLSLYCVVSGIRTQVIRFENKLLYLLSFLASTKK